MRKFAGVICLVAITSLVLAPSVALAAFQSYLAVKGAKQGKYKGQTTQAQQPNTKRTGQGRTVKPSSTYNQIVPNKQGPSQYPIKH
jgi:hypothetical protein